MRASEVRRAVAAATSEASTLRLEVDDVIVVHNSNRVALRLLPCDVLARVAGPAKSATALWRTRHGMFEPGPELEVEVARRLADTDCPIARLEPRVEPRVYRRDGFTITLWRFHEPVDPRDIAPVEYARALERLHAGMRDIDVVTPHFVDRVAEAQWLVDGRSRTPGLADGDRDLLGKALSTLRRTIDARGASEQLLHGEPHPGNVLRSEEGLLFIDLETCCRGPVEFDIAHAPEPIGEHYGSADRDLVRQCRMLVLAMITTWRWEPSDELPDGLALGRQWLDDLRTSFEGSVANESLHDGDPSSPEN